MKLGYGHTIGSLEPAVRPFFCPLLLLFLTRANIGDFTLKDDLVFLLILTLVSVIFGFLSICGTETKNLR